MDFLIADTFTDSLARLTRDEQKVVKTTAFDLQLNSGSLGMSFHRLEKARDRGFWTHLAKGLEFRAVAVIACDDEVLPLQERIESVADSADLQEVYNTERHLLYVACTRVRGHLLVTSVAPASEFLDDLRL